MESPRDKWDFQMPADINPHLWTSYTFDRYNLWAFIDLRNAVQAIEKGLTAEYEGSHPLFVNEAHNSLDYDSMTLAKLFLPTAKEWKTSISALISNRKAYELIGYKPEPSIQGAMND